jgi:hypothetical protein
MTDYQPERDEPAPYDLAFPDDPAALQAEIDADRSAPEWDSADSAAHQARVEAGLEPDAAEAYVLEWPPLRVISQGQTVDTAHLVMNEVTQRDQPYAGMTRAVEEPESSPEPEAEL